MPDFQYTYWDANVFISYLNDDKDRMPVLEAILDAVESSKIARIVTSVISKVEVTWVAQEKLNRNLSVEEEKRIDEMWENDEIFEMVEFNNEIALMARKLMRIGLSRGWRLRTNDAIHLASAKWVGQWNYKHTISRILRNLANWLILRLKSLIPFSPNCFSGIVCKS